MRLLALALGLGLAGCASSAKKTGQEMVWPLPLIYVLSLFFMGAFIWLAQAMRDPGFLTIWSFYFLGDLEAAMIVMAVGGVYAGRRFTQRSQAGKQDRSSTPTMTVRPIRHYAHAAMAG